MSSFADFSLLASLQRTLKDKGFVRPTEIQRRTIPAILEGQSVVGLAETGGGKTLSYVLPVLHALKTLEDGGEAIALDAHPRAAVLVPTRELGEQVAKVFKLFTHDTRLRVRTVLGGTAMEVARRNASGRFEVLVATPGRLIQLMERDLLRLDDVRTLVFDEADQMLDQGFLESAKRIAGECARDRQMVLFSATLPPAVQDLVSELFSSAEIVKSRGSDRTVPTLKTENRIIKDGKRFPVLEKLLSKPFEGGTLIFTNTREQCDKLAEELAKIDRECVIYRGEMDKVERRRNLKSFREGGVDLLVSTDLASRGLDVEHVARVINYHLPQQIENYIHRVGRTARAGREGLVINFVTERDQPLLREVEKISSNPTRKK